MILNPWHDNVTSVSVMKLPIRYCCLDIWKNLTIIFCIIIHCFNNIAVPPAMIEDELSEYVEQNTRDQRKCQIWKDLHIGRITSSLFGDVMKSSNPNSLVKQILEGSNLDRYQSF